METLHQPSLLRSDCRLLAHHLQTYCRDIPEAGVQDGLVLPPPKVSVSPIVDR